MILPMKNATITLPYKSQPPAGINYAKGYHTGIDMVSNDKAIYAPVSGSVIARGHDPQGWGNYVILRSGDYDLIFAHLQSSNVIYGQEIKAGDKIGIMGATGQVTGAHLHFEVRTRPWNLRNDVDPAEWLGIENKRGPVTEIKKKAEDDNVDKLVIYADGDIGAALTYSQAHGIPMVRANEDGLEAVIKKYPAKKYYLIGFKGQDTPERKYFSGKNRLETAKEALNS